MMIDFSPQFDFIIERLKLINSKIHFSNSEIMTNAFLMCIPKVVSRNPLFSVYNPKGIYLIFPKMDKIGSLYVLIKL